MHLTFCSAIPFIAIMMAYNETINPIVIKSAPKIIFLFNEILLLLVLKSIRYKTVIGDNISNNGMIKIFTTSLSKLYIPQNNH